MMGTQMRRTDLFTGLAALVVGCMACSGVDPTGARTPPTLDPTTQTFTFEKDVEALRGRGLALGGSLNNAIVLGDDGILNDQELRFPDEFVRHKILDLTGDLSLVGRAVRAHVVAYRAGHDMHLRLARAILQARDSWYLAPWSEEAPSREAPAQA